METLWSKGPSSIRELQEAFPESGRPAYTTVQTVVYRLEFKKAVRRASKVSNAHVFEAVVSRSSAQHRMIDDPVRPLPEENRCPCMSHLIESGKLTPEEVREASASAPQPRKEGEGMTAIANHLLQSTLFGAIAVLLTLAFRKNRAQIRYALWLSASVKFLIPFSLLIALGSHFGTRTTVVIAQRPR